MPQENFLPIQHVTKATGLFAFKLGEKIKLEDDKVEVMKMTDFICFCELSLMFPFGH